MATKLCVCYMAALLLTHDIDGILAQLPDATPSPSARKLRGIQPTPPPPWKPPYNAFAHAPLHVHNYPPPMQQGAPTLPPLKHPKYQILPLPRLPDPFFTTLPFPLPRPFLCPPFRIPPPGYVTQHGRVAPSPSSAEALYQNISPRPIYPFFPFPYYSIRCFPPLLFPPPIAGAPQPIAGAPQPH